MKFKKNKILKFFFSIFLFSSSLILAQDVKYNIIKEISTMEEIDNKIFTNSNKLSNNLKTVSDILGDENREDGVNKYLTDNKDENPELQKKEEEKKNSLEASANDNNDLQRDNEIEENNKEIVSEVKESKNNEGDETISYSLPKIEKNFSNSPEYNSIKEKEKNNNKTNASKKHEYREREKKENRFEEINDRTNRVTALGSAMGAVDLGSTPKKKIRLGAGVGNSSSSQAVAVGIGYAPTDRFRVNTKFSSSTNNMNNNSISVGASYDLDL